MIQEFINIAPNQKVKKLSSSQMGTLGVGKILNQVKANIFLSKITAHISEQVLQEQKKIAQQKFRFPARIDSALVHKNAIKFGYNPAKLRKGFMICPCCNQNVNTQKIPICYETTSIDKQVLENDLLEFKLLSGISLFFAFIKMLIIYLLFRCIISDLFNIISSWAQGAHCKKDSKCIQGLFTVTSGYNRYESSNDSFFVVQDILNLVLILLSLPFFFFYRKFQYQLYDQIDAVKQTQDDYALFIQNIPILDFPEQYNKGSPLQFNYRQRIQGMINQKIDKWLKDKDKFNQYPKRSLQRDFHEITTASQQIISQGYIKSTILCYDLSDFQKLNQLRYQKMFEFEKLNSNLKVSQSQQEQNADQQNQIFYSNPFKHIPNQITFLNQSQILLSKKYAMDNSLMFNMTKFLGKAFISLQYQHYRQHIIDQQNQDPSFLTFDMHPLKISRAFNPHDIFWENLRVTDTQRIKKIIISFLIMSMTLTFAFAAVLGIDIAKRQSLVDPQTSQQQPNLIISANIIKNYTFTILATILILVVNTILYYIIIALTQFEKHKTRTHYFLSLIIKLLISQFLNTAIIYYIITIIKSTDFLEATGLVNDISWLIIISGFIQIFLNALHPFHLYYKFMIWWNYRNKNNQDYINKFQVNLNNQFAFVQFDLVGRYSYYLLQIYTAFFYSYITPIGIPALALIFFFQYWIDKYNLFNRSSFGYDVHFTLSKAVAKLFEISLFIFALGNLIFGVYVEKRLSALNLISLIITFLFSVFVSFSNEKIERKLFGTHESLEQFSYTDCIQKGKFQQTYWKTNPATNLVRQSDVTNHKNIDRKGKNIIYGIQNRNSKEVSLALSRVSIQQ